MSESGNGGTRRSVTLSDELWQRIANYRHVKRIDRFSDAFRQVVEAGLAAVEAAPPMTSPNRKGRAVRPAVKVLAYLILGAILAGDVSAAVHHPELWMAAVAY